MAPNQRKFVNTKIYKLPEKSKIPDVKRYPIMLNFKLGIKYVIKPKIINARE